MRRADPRRTSFSSRRAAGTAAVVLAALLLSAPAAGQPEGHPAPGEAGTSLHELEEQADEKRDQADRLEDRTATLGEQLRALKAKSVTVARRAQDLESELTAIERTLTALESARADTRADLAARRGQLAETLAALQRIAVLPPEALAVAQADPLEVVRSASLLGVAVPELERRAAELREQIADLRQLTREIEAQRSRLERTSDELAEERRALDRLMARKRTLRSEAAAQSRQAAEEARRLAREAQSMRHLLQQLRAQEAARAEALRQRRAEPAPRPGTKPAPPGRAGAPDGSGGSASGGGASGDGTTAAGASGKGRQIARRPPGTTPQTAPSGRELSRPANVRDFPDRQDSLTLPARGRVVTRFGETMQRAGGAIRAKGIEIAARAGARVVAPYDGKVVYAGPFRGYGRILIIEHGGRYHSLLAGLERIDAVVGQWVLAGEPVGVMAGSDGDTSAVTGPPKLYVELRRTGQPINPLPWLAHTSDKVRG